MLDTVLWWVCAAAVAVLWVLHTGSLELFGKPTASTCPPPPPSPHTQNQWQCQGDPPPATWIPSCTALHLHRTQRICQQCGNICSRSQHQCPKAWCVSQPADLSGARCATARCATVRVSRPARHSVRCTDAPRPSHRWTHSWDAGDLSGSRLQLNMMANAALSLMAYVPSQHNVLAPSVDLSSMPVALAVGCNAMHCSTARHCQCIPYDAVAFTEIDIDVPPVVCSLPFSLNSHPIFRYLLTNQLIPHFSPLFEKAGLPPHPSSLSLSCCTPVQPRPSCRRSAPCLCSATRALSPVKTARTQRACSSSCPFRHPGLYGIDLSKATTYTGKDEDKVKV